MTTNTDHSRLRVASATILATLCLVILAATSTAHAWPQPIVDSVYTKSTGWIPVTATANGNHRFYLTLSANCNDPVGTRGLSATTFCGTASARPDVWVHVFRSNDGETMDPYQCTAALGSSNVTCDFTVAMTPGSYAIMVHGGPNAKGMMNGNLQVFHPAGVPQIAFEPLSLGGEILVDITGGSRPYDIATVLVPDGPGTNGSNDPGNAANDYLGVDATEAWVFNANGRAVYADLKHRGVGAAALITGLAINAGSWALVRQWKEVPFNFGVKTTTGTLPVWVGNAPALNNNIVGAGRMRVVFNDWWSGGDADQDGLTTSVENAIGLCAGTNAFADGPSSHVTCVTVAMLADPARRDHVWMDPRDTDGDGISDRAEVIGADTSEGPTTNPATGGCNAAAAPTVTIDSDQTFPLWGFSPMHKDALVEVDRASVVNWIADPDATSAIATCVNRYTGCPVDGQTFPFRVAGPEVNTQLMGLTAGLIRARNHLASLNRERVFNPDGVGGIALHYDARLKNVATQAHGSVPQFLITDPATNSPAVGLVIYVPGVESNGESRYGSTCGCNAGSVCPSLRHGGYSHYSRVDDQRAFGGGQSGLNGIITANGMLGDTWAHELGHHLGVGHSEPNANAAGPQPPIPNPFAPRDPFSFNGKLSFVSLMNYYYDDWQRFPENATLSQFPSFSSGARSQYPVPRSVGTSSLLVIPEKELFGPFSVTRHSDPVGNIQGETPLACINGNMWCTDADFDGDNVANPFGVDRVVQGADGSGYRKGYHLHNNIGTYWCGGADRRAISSGAPGCCMTPFNPMNNTCTGGERAGSVLGVDNSPRLGGQPVAAVASNRLFGFFWDETRGANAELNVRPRDCRCSVADQTNGLCNPALCRTRSLRWFANDDFAPPAGADVVPHTCLTRDCFRANIANGPLNGEVSVDGSKLETIGMTSASMDTVIDGATETVAFAYTSRSSDCAAFDVGGGINPPNCGGSWSAPRVRFATRAQIETTGFINAPGAAVALIVPAGGPALSQADYVTVAAFNPNTITGAPDRAFVVVRQVEIPADGRGAPLWYTTCAVPPGVGCAALQPLLLNGMQLRSVTGVSLAVANATMNEPRIAYLAFRRNDPALDQLEADQGIRLLRIVPQVGAVLNTSVVRLRNPLGSPFAAIVAHAIFSGVSIEFSSSNLLMLTFEQPVPFTGSIGAVPEYRTATAPITGTTAEMLTTAIDSNPENFSRERVGQFQPMAGSPQTNWEQGPGRVPFLRRDRRSTEVATEPGAEPVANRIRIVMTAPENTGVAAELWTVGENANIVPLFDFEEHSTLGFNLCRTLEASAQGRRSPDLRTSAYGRLVCPGARGVLGDNGGGELVNVYEPMLNLHCRPYPFCALPDPRFIELVASQVTLRSQSVDGFSSSAATTGMEPIRTAPRVPCAAEIDPVMFPTFPSGWNGVVQ